MNVCCRLKEIVLWILFLMLKRGFYGFDFWLLFMVLFFCFLLFLLECFLGKSWRWCRCWLCLSFLFCRVVLVVCLLMCCCVRLVSSLMLLLFFIMLIIGIVLVGKIFICYWYGCSVKKSMCVFCVVICFICYRLLLMVFGILLVLIVENLLRYCVNDVLLVNVFNCWYMLIGVVMKLLCVLCCWVICCVVLICVFWL